MELGIILVEIPQRGDRSRTELNLVKKEQRLAGDDLLSGNELDLGADFLDVDIRVKDGIEFWRFLEVEFDVSCEFLGEMTDCGGLADLPRTAKQKRFSGAVLAPIRQRLVDSSGNVHKTVLS